MFSRKMLEKNPQNIFLCAEGCRPLVSGPSLKSEPEKTQILKDEWMNTTNTFTTY